MWRLFLIAAVCVGMAGCDLVSPIGAIVNIGVFWMNREANKYYATPFFEMGTAVEATLAELELDISDDTLSEDIRTIKIEDEDYEDRFRIKLERTRHNVTKVSILINTLGDKPYAEMIYRHIDDQPDVIQFTTVEELKTALEE